MSIILNTDGYKASHYLQYPKSTKKVFSYVEARGSDGFDDPYDDTSMDEVVFLYDQGLFTDILSQRITREDIDFAEKFFKAYGAPFNKLGWEYILEKHDGYLPIEVKAAPQGTVIPLRHVMMTIVNTDDDCEWLVPRLAKLAHQDTAHITNYTETATLRAVWYPTTVGTISREIKKVIKEYFDLTSTDYSSLDFKLHDFGYRGASSDQSAGIGGWAHLTSFKGTDTIAGILHSMKYHESTLEDMPGFTIPAAEHSTITSHATELAACENMLEQFGKPGAMFAVVADSYDFKEHCDTIWGKTLKDKLIQSGATLVSRPDSGDPVAMVLYAVQSYWKSFGGTTNSKGFKVLAPCIRVIQGDGIDRAEISNILKALMLNGFSAENVAFGMGGALLQKPTRDTFQFAMKCSAIELEDGTIREVFKAPKTDMRKASKKGILTLVKDIEGNFSTVKVSDIGDKEEVLKVIFRNGRVIKEYSMKDIRANASI